MKRPQSSGMIGALLMLAIIFLAPGHYSPVASLFPTPLLCSIMPWRCIYRAAEYRPHYTSLVFSKSGHGKPVCVCHLDFQEGGSPWLHHVSPGTRAQSCDLSDAQENIWQDVDSKYCDESNARGDRGYCIPLLVRTAKESFNVYSGRYRYHCTSDPTYLRDMDVLEKVSQ